MTAEAEPAAREIAILNPNRYPEAAVRHLRPWLERLLDEIAPEATSFGVRFAGDRELRRANRDYRGKDYATDVLSFPGEEGDGHLGDVLISVPRARHQALEAGHGPEREVEILLLHGVLHCLGHDHETDDGAMERLERRLRKKFLSSAR
ncbi:MAG TPA: rRNA maturation RNase YbeY [Thermoanaerobaculia bacterium]|nr:rRNA maturation RNase YbeY [Thermoanaerobaculia bacterium]